MGRHDGKDTVGKASMVRERPEGTWASTWPSPARGKAGVGAEGGMVSIITTITIKASLILIDFYRVPGTALSAGRRLPHCRVLSRTEGRRAWERPKEKGS